MHEVGHVYGAISRVETRTAESGVTSGKLTSSHSYVFSDYDSNRNMPLVTKITQSIPGGAAMCFEYT